MINVIKIKKLVSWGKLCCKKSRYFSFVKFTSRTWGYTNTSSIYSSPHNIINAKLMLELRFPHCFWIVRCYKCISCKLKTPFLVTRASYVLNIFFKQLYCSISLFNSQGQNTILAPLLLASRDCNRVKWYGWNILFHDASDAFQWERPVSVASCLDLSSF